jgi:hypothetical protein
VVLATISRSSLRFYSTASPEVNLARRSPGRREI